MRLALFALLLALPAPLLQVSSCGASDTTTEVCDCPSAGHGARICDENGCGACMCLLLEPVDPDPTPTSTFYVDPDVASGGNGSASRPWTSIDWPEVDAALARGDVHVFFSALEADGSAPESWGRPLDVNRLDTGPYRLLLDGIGRYNASDITPEWRENPGRMRAVVRGISTGYDNIARHRVTVRGFESTGSDDKGLYWRAGDDIVIEDLVVHDNYGSPAINLEYVNRTGMPSASFIVRNNHVYNQGGECVYIGGVEGEDMDAHRYVEVSNNLIHHCLNPLDNKHDGINIKDRIGDVVVRRNVVFNTHWGIEAASPGLYAQNLVFDTESNGFHLNDYGGTGMGGSVLEDNTVIRARENGIRLDAENMSTYGVIMERTTVIDSLQAGLLFGGTAGLGAAVEGLVLAENRTGMDGWGDVTIELGDCVLDANMDDDAGAVEGVTASCAHEDLAFGDLSNPAGPDGLFFTGDDPYLP